MLPIYPDANLTWWKLLLPAVTRGPVWVGWEVPTLRWLLTYWGRNKMATFCRWHFQVRFLDADVGNLIQIYSNFSQASTGQYVPQMALVTHTQTHIHTHLCTYIDGLVRERRSSIPNALELRLSCTNPLIWYFCLCVWHSISTRSPNSSQDTSVRMR